MRPNIFDRLGANVFDRSSRTFGYPATWLPTDGSDQKSARVLYKDPTETTKILQLEYNPRAYALEYKEGDFPGLKELVDESPENESDEQIVITFNLEPLDQVTYYVRAIHTITDGRIYLALLEKA